MTTNGNMGSIIPNGHSVEEKKTHSLESEDLHWNLTL